MDTGRIKESILDNGAFFTKDPEIGRIADTFTNIGYVFQTEVSLNLLRKILTDGVRLPRSVTELSNILQRVRDTVKSSLEKPGLGILKAFGPHTGTARAPLNRTTDELLALTVLLCRSGSRVTLYKGSQELKLDAKPGGTGQLELP
jgi:hypothetical protein